MRTVSFVDCFELEFEGSVFSKAMLAADVDNDNVSTNVSRNLDLPFNHPHCGLSPGARLVYNDWVLLAGVHHMKTLLFRHFKTKVDKMYPLLAECLIDALRWCLSACMARSRGDVIVVIVVDLLSHMKVAQQPAELFLAAKWVSLKCGSAELLKCGSDHH